ncbi:hypothetical protein GBAR_LOCUS15311, partial [Geodia barretti]
MWRMVYVCQQWIDSSVAMCRIDRMYIYSHIFILNNLFLFLPFLLLFILF